MSQPSLFDDRPPAVVREGTRGTIQERFERFHKLNPWVLAALEKLVEDWLGCGRKKLGIGMLWEVLRWQHALATTDPAGDFKLDNVYRSRYARLMIERHPDWSDVFELRTLRA